MQPQDFIDFVLALRNEDYKKLIAYIEAENETHIWDQICAIQDWEDACQEVKDGIFPQDPLTQTEKKKLEDFLSKVYEQFKYGGN